MTLPTPLISSSAARLGGEPCFTGTLAGFLSGHDVTTVGRLFGASNRDDGELLDRLAAHCDAFVTVDKNLPFQQNLRGHPSPIILLRAHSNSIEHVASPVPEMLRVLPRAVGGELRVVGV